MLDRAVFRPCPTHVLYGGRKNYCEQGEKGHEGTCFGAKSYFQYERELEAWRAARRVRREKA